jgi:hypothetical protein
VFINLINKWLTRKAANSNVKGDWESREINYSANQDIVIGRKEDIPSITHGLLMSKIMSGT